MQSAIILLQEFSIVWSSKLTHQFSEFIKYFMKVKFNVIQGSNPLINSQFSLRTEQFQYFVLLSKVYSCVIAENFYPG